MVSKKLRVASTNIYSQQFDDEVLVIDTVTGLYFSLRASAAIVWPLLERSTSFECMMSTLHAHYTGDDEVMSASLQSLLETLGSHNLIVEDSELKVDSAPEPVVQEKADFAPPLVEHYDDMHNLLLLDPIHDVSEQGWPHTNPANEPKR